MGSSHNPLPIHSRAEAAAEAAECAGQQGQFWAMHDRLFGDPKKLDDSDLAEYARALGLDLSAFATCRPGSGNAIVRRDVAVAKDLGLKGTPTFLIGEIVSDGRVKIADVIAGARPVADFEVVIDRRLKAV
jgi:protein-disulfide isomerase